MNSNGNTRDFGWIIKVENKVQTGITRECRFRENDYQFEISRFALFLCCSSAINIAFILFFFLIQFSFVYAECLKAVMFLACEILCITL